MFARKRMCGWFAAAVLAESWIVAGVARAQAPVVAPAEARHPSLTYAVVDTAQALCYDDATVIPPQKAGAAFSGQDAQVTTHPPSYRISPDRRTVHDTVTGLTWVRTPDVNGDGVLNSNDKVTWAEFAATAARFNQQKFGGYTDWRVPTIKELYSLMDFRGVDLGGGEGVNPAKDKGTLRPFLDRTIFDFTYGDPKAGERAIDAQYLSSTQYTSTTMGGAATVFGVNFADGRIKGYPRDRNPGGRTFKGFLRLVRGNPEYGKNQFVDHGDGTITDTATGLMWMKNDSGRAMDWKSALAFADSFTLAGHSDWRLPDAKELQSLVEYSRSPDATDSPAIDPLFACTTLQNEGGRKDWPAYWSSTTHVGARTGGRWAVYVCFGRGLGWMSLGGPPPAAKPGVIGKPSADARTRKTLMDVHGAGAQRSDPKAGDPKKFAAGHGPQGDVVRIQNHVRCVRTATP